MCYPNARKAASIELHGKKDKEEIAKIEQQSA